MSRRPGIGAWKTLALGLCAWVAASSVGRDWAGGDVEKALQRLESGEVATEELSELLRGELAPERLARYLVASRSLLPPVFGRLLDLHSEAGGIDEYLRLLGQAHVLELSDREHSWPDREIFGLLTTLLVDPARFVAEEKFRRRALTSLPTLWPGSASPELRGRVLEDIHRLRWVTFDDVEAIEAAWGAVPRTSRERRLGSDQLVAGSVRAEGPIEASIFSLPSSFFTPQEAEEFLRAVEKGSPGRRLLILSDGPVRRKLAKGPRSPETYLLETHGRPYTPWIRDPLLPMVAGGRWMFVERPNRQKGREADGDLGKELLQGLPVAVDQWLGRPRIVRSPVPFHNGQVLLTAHEVWVGLHTVELRALQILGLERVPVASFTRSAGIDQYLAAAEQAAEELADLYGRPVRWIHDLPRLGSAAQRSLQMQVLGGGAGFDLDSLLTILPQESEPPVALVGDPAAGSGLLRQVTSEEWSRFARIYGLEPGAREEVLTFQRVGRAGGLSAYLDQVSAHLEATGLVVHRLPLLLIPGSAGAENVTVADFLVTWVNVVLERRGAGRDRAEGFASGLSAGDDMARAAFERSGYELVLFPPLVASIRGNGGYRCASNHLRAESVAGTRLLGQLSQGSTGVDDP